MNIDRIIRWLTPFEKSALTDPKFPAQIPADTNALSRKSLCRTGLIDETGALTDLGVNTRERLLGNSSASPAKIRAGMA